MAPHLAWLLYDPSAREASAFLTRILINRLVLLTELPDHLSHLLEQGAPHAGPGVQTPSFLTFGSFSAAS